MIFNAIYSKFKFIILSLILLNITSAVILHNTKSIYNQSKYSQILGANNAPTFDPNFVVSDYTFSSKRVFPTEASIQQYLENVNSPLRNYRTNGKLASSIIFTASNGTTSSNYGIKPNLNPGLLLAYLEKEQSLLSLKDYNTASDPEKRIRSAMGLGCPDDEKCKSEYYGFENQMNWGAFQLQFNYDKANTTTGDNYKIGKTITTLDKYNVYLSNAATASAYRYTPHVYWGNYSLWKIITANGWGQSSTTYNYADIDLVNLKNKEKPIAQSTPTIITMEKVDITPTLSNNCKTTYELSYTDMEEGQRIRELQLCLKSDNAFDYPSITGRNGPITQEGLAKMRSKLGISSPSSQGQIREITIPKPQAPTPIKEINYQPKPQDNCQTLKNSSFAYGATSDKNKQLQDCMTTAGVYKWKYGSTGYFGDVTRDALAKWRKG
jgi:hypothetical protein